jgi:hypothetical protein
MDALVQAERRFFWGLLAGVVLLAAVALAVALARQGQAVYRTDDTPTSAVYNFLLALQRDEPQKAYALLGAIPCKPPLEEFVARAAWPAPLTVSLGAAQSENGHAWVTLHFQASAGPFSESTGPNERVVLRREQGHWKITRLPPELWPFSPPWPDGHCPPSPGGD